MNKDKADQAWKKIIARLSSSGFDESRLEDEFGAELLIDALNENTVDFTTTPEGFNWIYEFFVKQSFRHNRQRTRNALYRHGF